MVHLKKAIKMVCECTATFSLLWLLHLLCTLDLSSSCIQMGALSHTLTPFCSVCRQFFGFIPGDVHVLQIPSDDVHQIFPWPSWLSLIPMQKINCRLHWIWVNYKICIILLGVSLGLYPLADACQDDGIPQDPEPRQAWSKSRREEDQLVSSAISVKSWQGARMGGPNQCSMNVSRTVNISRHSLLLLCASCVEW